MSPTAAFRLSPAKNQKFAGITSDGQALDEQSIPLRLVWLGGFGHRECGFDSQSVFIFLVSKRGHPKFAKLEV